MQRRTLRLYRLICVTSGYEMATAAVLEILPEAGVLSPGTNLADDLKADSVDLIEIVACVERDLDMTIDEDLIYEVETVGDLANLIDKLRNG